MALFDDAHPVDPPDKGPQGGHVTLLKQHLAHIAATLDNVQHPAILTVYGDVVESLSEKCQSCDEFIVHAISVVNLSSQFMSLLKLGTVSSIKVRGVGETVLNIYTLTDEVILTFYCLKSTDNFVMFEGTDIDLEIQGSIDAIRSVVSKNLTFADRQTQKQQAR